MIIGTVSCKAILPMIYVVGLLNIILLCAATAVLATGQIIILKRLKDKP